MVTSITLLWCLGCVSGVLYLILVCWALRAIRIYYLIRKRFLLLPAETRRKYQAFDRIDFDNVRRIPIGEDGNERSFGSALKWHWDLYLLCLGAITLFPIRILLGLAIACSNLVWLHVLSNTCTLDVTLANVETISVGETQATGASPPPLTKRVKRNLRRAAFLRRLLKLVMGWHCRVEMFLMGVIRVREFQVLEGAESEGGKLICKPGLSADFRPDAPRCVVSNHVSSIDILYFIWRSYPSFIAKASALKDPIIGPCAKALNCVFIDRKSPEDRERAKRVIDERQTELWKLSVQEYLESDEKHEKSSQSWLSSLIGDTGGSGSQVKISNKLKRLIKGETGRQILRPIKYYHDEVPPLLIFPEGTTSAQRSIMPLKRGAFLGMKPVTPVVLIYRCKGFHPAFDVVPTIWWIPLLFSSLFPTTLDVYWLPQVIPPPPYDVAETTSSSRSKFDFVGEVDLASTMTSLSDKEPPSRMEIFSENVRGKMTAVLQAFKDWDMPKGIKLPEEWQGSLRLKFELVNEIFTGSPTERPTGPSPQRRRRRPEISKQD